MVLKHIAHNESVACNDFWEFKGKVDYVDDWFLMKSPLPLFFLTASYLLFVLKLGPKFMKNRSQFSLSEVLIFYNFFQVMFSCFLLSIGSRIIIDNGLLGTSCLMDNESSKWTVTSSIYYYFIAKVTELMDTIFFVLRKNYHQVTFLHIYHHTMMMCCTWIMLKYEPSQSTIFLGNVNSFVHIIMYGYYALSAFPGLVRYLWWKKYITIMQMLQFACIILQAAVSYVYTPCPPSYTLLLTISLNAVLFIILFANFYVKAYLMKNRGKCEQKNGARTEVTKLE
ncbi:unnamed protein product, partial [Iphiclides podalirius]